MTRFLTALVAVFLWALPGGEIQAQEQQQQQQPLCLPHNDMTKMLTEKFGEKVLVRGLGKDGEYMVEFFASHKNGQWTAVVTTAKNQVACITALGVGLWTFLPPVPGQDV